MSDIIDIHDMRKALIEKTEKKDIEAFAVKQQEIIELQQFEIKTLKEKNQHLEQLLTSLSKGESVKEVSQEEMICIEQIFLLKRKSSERELTLDEAKRLDLFIKNLKVIRGDSIKNADIISVERMDENDLIKIATSTD